MPSQVPQRPLLAVYPSRRGFGFAVASEAIGLTDWGLARVRGNDADAYLERIDNIVRRYAVCVVIVEAFDDFIRGRRVRERIEALGQYADARGLSLLAITRYDRMIVLSLSPRASNHDLAVAIAMRFPELEIHLPKRRVRWKSEDERIAIFAAVSCLLVAATHYS